MNDESELKDIIEEIDFTVTSYMHGGNKLSLSQFEVIQRVSSIIFNRYLPLKDMKNEKK